MIFVTGDLHGDKKRFKGFKKIKKNDTLLVCGDFGFVWNKTRKENHLLKWIGKRKYNVAFVDGYYDNLDILEQYLVSAWNGGLARVISGKLVMLMRGEIYGIGTQHILAFGGGYTDDSEGAEELYSSKIPTEDEINNAKSNLQKHGNKVDYIITHDAPAKIKLFIQMESNEVNHLHTVLEDISKTCEFKKWFIGKYHKNKIISASYQLLYTDVIKLPEQ